MKGSKLQNYNKEFQYYIFDYLCLVIIDLKGKTALVCGSSQGIGRAIAQEMAASGANIILLARNEERLNSVMANLSSTNGQVHSVYSADFSNTENVLAVANQIVAKHAVDILVNNTGGPAAGKAIDANTVEFLQAFNAHLINNHQLVQAVVPGMKTRSFGRIINIISTSVKVPLHNLGVSNTIRGAVGNWSKTLANELASAGITVNNILPGATETERLSTIIQNKSNKMAIEQTVVKDEMLNEIPMRRFGKPEEVAYAAVFLASDKAAYITGTNTVVDGGRTPCL